MNTISETLNETKIPRASMANSCFAMNMALCDSSGRQELNQSGQDCVKLLTAPERLLANHCDLGPRSVPMPT
jgi:hypothetical protein